MRTNEGRLGQGKMKIQQSECQILWFSLRYMGLHILFVWFFVFVLCFLRQDFSVALEPFLELALVDQTGLELTEMHHQ